MSRIFDIVQSMSGQKNVIVLPRPYLLFFKEDQQAHALAAVLNNLVFWSAFGGEDGWFYKTHKELGAEAGELTEDQTERLVKKLVNKYLPGVIETCSRKVNGTPTKHYRIDGDALISLIFPENNDSAKVRNGKREDAESKPRSCVSQSVNNRNLGSRESTESYLYTDFNTELNKQTNKPICPVAPQPDDIDPAIRVLSHFNEVTGSSYGKGGRNKTVLGYIRGRLSEDYSAEDLMLVVDYLTAKWADDPKMDDYLRPSTLFGPENCVEYFDKAQKWQKRGRPACVKGRWQLGGSADQNFKANFQNVDYSVPANSGFRVSGGTQ